MSDYTIFQPRLNHKNPLEINFFLDYDLVDDGISKNEAFVNLLLKELGIIHGVDKFQFELLKCNYYSYDISSDNPDDQWGFIWRIFATLKFPHQGEFEIDSDGIDIDSDELDFEVYYPKFDLFTVSLMVNFGKIDDLEAFKNELLRQAGVMELKVQAEYIEVYKPNVGLHTVLVNFENISSVQFIKLQSSLHEILKIALSFNGIIHQSLE